MGSQILFKKQKQTGETELLRLSYSISSLQGTTLTLIRDPDPDPVLILIFILIIHRTEVSPGAVFW